MFKDNRFSSSELPDLYPANHLLACAVKDYINGEKDELIKVWMNGEKEEPYSPGYFLRSLEEMPDLELEALKRCKGKVLDIGAGAGAHSKYLINKGFQVTALEKEPLFCELLSNIKNLKVENYDVFEYETIFKYDTILLLMNGLGIAGTVKNLPLLIKKVKSLLKPKGRILVEITDYEYSEIYVHATSGNPEVTFRLLYKDMHSEEYNWVYPKYTLLKNLADNEFLKTEILFQEEESLLVEMTHKN